jgi:hypothetical protein
MARAFISYKDGTPEAKLADDLAARLESAGHVVFIDREIPPVEYFDDYIPEKIEASQIFIVLVTKAASESDWVRAELRVAHALKKEGRLAPAINLFSRKLWY